MNKRHIWTMIICCLLPVIGLGAILLCEQAPTQDADIRGLCENIISGQQAEIDKMKAKLGELER